MSRFESGRICWNGTKDSASIDGYYSPNRNRGVAVPLRGTFKSAIGTSTVQRSIIVTLVSSDGATGVAMSILHQASQPRPLRKAWHALSSRLGPSVLGIEAQNTNRISAACSVRLRLGSELRAAPIAKTESGNPAPLNERALMSENQTT